MEATFVPLEALKFAKCQAHRTPNTFILMPTLSQELHAGTSQRHEKSELRKTKDACYHSQQERDKYNVVLRLQTLVL